MTPERYDRQDAEIAFAHLTEAVARLLGANVDDWSLDHGHGGYVITKPEPGGGELRPLGSGRRSARAFCEAVQFAVALLEQESAVQPDPPAIYAFETIQGDWLNFTTRNAMQAREYGARTRTRVIVTRFEDLDPETAWDFREADNGTRDGDRGDDGRAQP